MNNDKPARYKNGRKRKDAGARPRKNVSNSALKERILRIVKDFFIASRDFNGIPATGLAQHLKMPWNSVRAAVAALIQQRRIDAVFESHQDNPHIRRLPALSAALQMEGLDTTDLFCLYPTSDVLKATRKARTYNDRPYTKRLFLGEPQLIPVYFELDALEPYFHDPRYAFEFHDFSGNISLKDDHRHSKDMAKRDKILLQSFGIAYDEHKDRCVVVYLRYLSDLSPEHQQIWKAKEITRPCKMNGDYAGATLYGHWPQHNSVYEAFIHEQVELNKLSALMGKPGLFLKTFEEKRPGGFHPMLRPTQRNYEEFIHLFDKLLSENINRECFRGDIEMEELIKNGKGINERRPLGTIKLLERWLKKYYRTKDGEDASKEVVGALAEVRKLRQQPAHSISANHYDKTLPSQQDELIKRVMLALQTLRWILSGHPKARAKHYKAPDWLDGDIVIY